MAFIDQGMCASSVKFNLTWCSTKLRHARFTHSASDADRFITQDFFPPVNGVLPHKLAGTRKLLILKWLIVGKLLVYLKAIAEYNSMKQCICSLPMSSILLKCLSFFSGSLAVL